MTVNLLSAFGDKALTGGFTFLLGIAVVFLGMITLVLSVTAVGKFVSSAEEKAANKAKLQKEVVKSPVEEETVEEGIPEDVKVAIIAAIAAYYTASGSKNEFKVRKIKKI